MRSAVEIRQIPVKYYQDSIALSEFAFQMEYTPEQRAERVERFKEKENWGAFIDDKLAAKLTIIDLHIWLNGRRMAMGGVASVATWPEYRRGGLVTGLLHHALGIMKEQGQTLSFLHPFQFAFYRKFGWETYTEYKKYEIPTNQLPRLPVQPGRIERVGKDGERLGDIYRAYAIRYNGTLDRTAEWWERRIFAFKKGSAAIYYDAEGQAAGYVYYQVKEQVCSIHEMVALTYEAEKALWRFIADHDSMIDKVILQAPADNQLPFLLDNPRIKQEVVPYFMARIVDVERFLAQYPFVSPVAGGMTLTLQVTDAHAAWNNGCFELQVDNTGAGHVTKLPEGAAKEPAPEEALTVSCDISTLSSMCMGYQRPVFLHKVERLSGSEAAVGALEQLIPRRQTYLPDFF